MQNLEVSGTATCKYGKVKVFVDNGNSLTLYTEDDKPLSVHGVEYRVKASMKLVDGRWNFPSYTDLYIRRQDEWNGQKFVPPTSKAISNIRDDLLRIVNNWHKIGEKNGHPILQRSKALTAFKEARRKLAEAATLMERARTLESESRQLLKEFRTFHDAHQDQPLSLHFDIQG